MKAWFLMVYNAVMDIYREVLMEHYRQPHNVGVIPNSPYKGTRNNPVCGDDVSVTLDIEEGKVKQIKHQSRGCAVSIASASILTDYLQNMSVKEATALSLDKLLELLGTPLTATRRQCAQVALDAMKAALPEV